jgi:hypothetical protein
MLSGVANKLLACIEAWLMLLQVCGTCYMTCYVTCYMIQTQNYMILIIIINPCKPYLSASATAPHPLGRRKAD